MFFAGAAEKRPSQAARGLHRRRLTSTVYWWNPPTPTIFLEGASSKNQLRKERKKKTEKTGTLSQMRIFSLRSVPIPPRPGGRLV